MWGEIVWESQDFCFLGFCATISIPVGITETNNDGVVEYSSVALSGADANYSDSNAYWDHGEVNAWTTATNANILRDNLLPWFNP